LVPLEGEFGAEAATRSAVAGHQVVADDLGLVAAAALAGVDPVSAVTLVGERNERE
jgi:hypothetical protein